MIEIKIIETNIDKNTDNLKTLLYADEHETICAGTMCGCYSEITALYPVYTVTKTFLKRITQQEE